MSPTTWMTCAPTQFARASAFGQSRPSSRPLITPAAKASPAPTVSTMFVTFTPGTRPEPSAVRQ